MKRGPRSRRRAVWMAGETIAGVYPEGDGRESGAL